MRLLFRHIKNSVLKAPYQAFILLLTVFFSAIIFASVTEVHLSVREEKFLGASLKRGSAEIVLEPSAESASRYLTLADAGLSEQDAVGYFALPLEAYGETALGGATDFDTVGNVFEFSFTAYEACSRAEMGTAVFITEDFANAHDLALGDALELKLLGKPRLYTVRGINKYDFFGRYAILLEAEGALDTLSAISPVFAAFDGENFPCSYIYVNVEEGEKEGTMSALNACVSPFGWRAEACEDGLDEYSWRMATFMMVLLLLLSMIIAWVLVGFSLRILGEKRKEEMRTFWLSGMPQRKIFLAFCIEISFYLLLGTGLGLLATVGFLRLLQSVGLCYAVLRLTWRGALVGLLSELAVGFVSLLVYKRSLNRIRLPKESKTKKWLLVCGVAFLCSLLCCLFFPVRWRIFPAIATLGFALGGIFLSAAPLCRGIARLCTARFHARGRGSPQFVLATKNCGNISEVHNVYRILNVLLSLAIVLTVGFSYFNRQIESVNEYFRFDYLLLNAGESVVEAVEELEGVDGAEAAFVGKATFATGEKLQLIDVDLSYFGGEGELPTGDGICLSETVAKLHGLKLGDKCTLELFGKEYAFTVTGYNGKTSFFAYIDAEHYGFRKDVVFVKGEESEQLLSALTQAVSIYGAIIGKPESLLSKTVRIAESFNRLMGAYLGLVFTLSAIGCINLIWVCYARRRKEFSDLVIAGMTKGEVGKMIALEGVVILLSTALVSAACGSLLCVALDNGMQAFGLCLFA